MYICMLVCMLCVCGFMSINEQGEQKSVHSFVSFVGAAAANFYRLHVPLHLPVVRVFDGVSLVLARPVARLAGRERGAQPITWD